MPFTGLPESAFTSLDWDRLFFLTSHPALPGDNQEKLLRRGRMIAHPAARLDKKKDRLGF